MKRIILNCIFFLAFVMHSNAQVDFQIQTLEELDSDKPIFIDVYTTWCGPCKKMDRTTFLDDKVSEYLNKNFTCLKWNAEDERFRDLAKGFDVKAYPTFLFLNADHELINSPIGFLSAEELIESAKEVLQFVKNNPLKNIKISSLSLDESSALLSQLTWLEGHEKSQLLDHLMGFMGNSDSLWRSHFELISLSAHNDIDLEYLEKLVHYNEPAQLYSNDAIRTSAKIERRLSTILEYKLKKAKAAANYQLFEKISHLKGDLALSTGIGRTQSYKAKQVKVDRLDYYRYNKVKECYLPLADSLIQDHIVPHTPENVMEADKTQTRYISKMRNGFMEEEQGEKVDSNSITFYLSQHTTALKIANRLDQIARSVLMLYDDKESLESALDYSILSYEYLKLPVYLVTKAKIQYALGDKQGAFDTFDETKAHKFYESQQIYIDKEMKKYSRN